MYGRVQVCESKVVSEWNEYLAVLVILKIRGLHICFINTSELDDSGCPLIDCTIFPDTLLLTTVNRVPRGLGI
jgi:hypothetical protein